MLTYITTYSVILHRCVVESVSQRVDQHGNRRRRRREFIRAAVWRGRGSAESVEAGGHIVNESEPNQYS